MQAAFDDLTIEAALTGSRDVALQILLIDSSIESLKRAEGLLDAIFELQTPRLHRLARQTPIRQTEDDLMLAELWLS